MAEPFTDPPDPPRVHYSFKPTEHKRVTDSDAKQHPDRIEVQQILRDNVAAEGQAQSPGFATSNYKSRRKRDYLLMITIPNLCLAGLVYYFRANNVVSYFGVALMFLYSLGLSWVMWMVMDED